MDYFHLLGLPRRLSVDPELLRAAYFERIRQQHPDRRGDGAAASSGAQEHAAVLNQAYRTLRDPVSRARHWLELHGEPLRGDDVRVPMALASLHFSIRERSAARARGRSEDVAGGQADQARLRATRTQLEVSLLECFRRFDAGDVAIVDVGGLLRSLLLQLACVDRLQRDLDEDGVVVA